MRIKLHVDEMINKMQFFPIFLLTIISLCIPLSQSGKAPKYKNILFIVADDLGEKTVEFGVVFYFFYLNKIQFKGWADIGYGDDQVLTPNINKLAQNGIILNQSYVYPLCKLIAYFKNYFSIIDFTYRCLYLRHTFEKLISKVNITKAILK